MKDKGKLSKLVWLVLLVAFAAIAGGGCGGSSSGGGSGDGVTNVGKTDHPLLDYLREHADPETLQKIKDRVHVVGNTMTLEELTAAMPELQEAFEEGKIIGMFGPRQELIDELHAGLGINVIKAGPAAGSLSAAAADEQASEFFMMTRRNGIVFENTIRYVAGSADAVSPITGDGSLIEKLRTKADHYPAFAERIAGWHDRVTELVKEVSADRKVAVAELRAAAAAPELTNIGVPLHQSWDTQFEDIASGVKYNYKFPMITVNALIWSSYSFAADRNIYLIKTSGSMNPEANYHHWQEDRDREINFTALYKSWAEMKGISDTGDKDKLWLLDHRPLNLNNVTDYEQSFSWNIGGSAGGNLDLHPLTGELGAHGELGANGFGGEGKWTPDFGFGVNAGISGGVQYSDTKHWTVHDYEVKDTTSGAVPSVNYEFSYTDPKSEQRLGEPSNIAKSNFTSNESWIWIVARSEDTYQFDHHVRYESQFLSATETTLWFGKNDGTAEPRGHEATQTLLLPIPPTFVLKGNQLIVDEDGHAGLGSNTVTISMASSGKWTSECDVDWIELAVKSGDKTGSSHREILVDIKPNMDPHVRIGYITLTGPNDPSGKPQTAMIEVQQQGGRK